MRPQYQLEKHPKAKSHIVQASPLCAFPPSRASELRPGNQRGLDSSRAGAPPPAPQHVSLILDADRAGPKPVAVRSQSNRVTFADGLNTRILVHHHSTSALGSTRERAYDDEDGGFAKKTRLENDELIDGDEEAE
ncbi:hypothetical protein EV361DRAFT_957294 [Lentinula raphanica]|nr:hypothetical protein EV361DRAFT_957294 [Lentinula raphanica]